MTLRITAVFGFVVAALFSGAQTKLKPFEKFHTNVSEPSDIAYSTDYSQMYIVSDKGILYKTDTLGKKIIDAEAKGLDFEGICMYNNVLYVTDERARRIMGYSPDSMILVRENEVAYTGAMNQGYEAITYNEVKKCFIIVTEKEPCWLFELNNDLVKINEKKLKIASDLSGLCYHDGFVYALSDENQMVIQLNASNYSVIQKWKIPVTNPEGITFDKNGNMVILSDVEQKIYKFKIK